MTKLSKEFNLFNDSGVVSEYGTAIKNGVNYNIKDAKLKAFSLKEWDFYQITSTEFCMQMTIGHVSYMASVNCTVFDFLTGNKLSVGRMIPFKKLNLDSNAEKPSEISYEAKDFSMSFKVEKGFRRLKLNAKDKKYGDIDVDVTMINQSGNSVIVVTPFDKPSQFYFNQKLNGMPTSGYAKFGQSDFNFSAKKNFALLDWGRGVLPFSHEWVWANGSGMLNGKPFGFNLGNFGKSENASENAVFFGGKTELFDKVTITFDKTDYNKPWNFKSECGRLNLTMTPTFDNYTTTKVLFVNNSCHQVFGKWNGEVKLKSGETIEVKDFFAFAENAVNNW